MQTNHDLSFMLNFVCWCGFAALATNPTVVTETIWQSPDTTLNAFLLKLFYMAGNNTIEIIILLFDF